MSKRATNQNARKHGAYSREPMLPGEKIRDYETLREEMSDEWAPEGVTEHGLVDRLVALVWRRQRIDRYEHESLQQLIRQINVQNDKNDHKQNLRNLAPEFAGAVSAEAVEKIFRTLAPLYVNTINHGAPRETYHDDIAKWGPAISEYLLRFRPEDQLEGHAKYIAMVNPDSIEVGLMRSDRIDEAIDRTIKRLMQIKTAKQIFPNMIKARADPKLINPPDQKNTMAAVTIENEQITKRQSEAEISAEQEGRS